MLWRVPNLHRVKAADTPSGDPKAWTPAGAGIDAGRRMVDTWRKSRLAPPKVRVMAPVARTQRSEIVGRIFAVYCVIACVAPCSLPV